MGASLHHTAASDILFTFSADVQRRLRLSPRLASRSSPRQAPRRPRRRGSHSRTASPSPPRPLPRPLAPLVRIRCPLPARRRPRPRPLAPALQSFVPAPSLPARVLLPPRRQHLRLSARAWAPPRARQPRRLLPLVFVRAPRNLQCHQRVSQGLAHRVPRLRVLPPPLPRPGRAQPHLALTV